MTQKYDPTAQGPAMKEGLKAMHAAGQGVWQLEFYTRENLLEGLFRGLTSARAPGARELALVKSMGRFVKHIPLSDPPILCLLCGHAFGETSLPEMYLWFTSAPDGIGPAAI